MTPEIQGFTPTSGAASLVGGSVRISGWKQVSHESEVSRSSDGDIVVAQARSSLSLEKPTKP